MSNVRDDAVPPVPNFPEPSCAAEANVDRSATGGAAEDPAAVERIDHATPSRADGLSGGEA